MWKTIEEVPRYYGLWELQSGIICYFPIFSRIVKHTETLEEKKTHTQTNTFIITKNTH